MKNPQPYKYVARLSYDGTQYNGFQLQSGTSLPPTASRTVQGELESALSRFLNLSRDELLVQGAGRTDAGVHARDQAIHFYSGRLLDVGGKSKSVLALNSLLPRDIRLHQLYRVPLDYNVRFSSGKIYTYDLHLGGVAEDPFTNRYRHHIRIGSNLDIEVLKRAAATFVGTHSFQNFSNKSRDGSRKNPIRTITRCEIVQNRTGTDPHLVRIVVQGNGFLYKQVRHMVGAMLSAARGRITPDDIKQGLEISGGDASSATSVPVVSRPGAYVVADARGLCLDTVFLPNPGHDCDTLMYNGKTLDELLIEMKNVSNSYQPPE